MPPKRLKYNANVIFPSGISLAIFQNVKSLLPPAYGVRGKVIFILGNVCLFTTPGTGYAWTGYAAGGAPPAVSRRRTFLLNETRKMTFDVTNAGFSGARSVVEGET